ncbi:MAG TPA: ABC transporter substrate-binding protein [Caldimonas sp.]|jgi:peptide/nickel transport system substrate-binding protein|nr:ABC transporter substrate-binding protein [Caldimonas sp.]HEX2542616.1 ABC transporter substrate-binding protein [Caldimonas sp.]
MLSWRCTGSGRRGTASRAAWKSVLTFLLGIVVGGLSLPAHAVTVKIATAFDPQTMDPHALALLYHSRIAFQVYDSLLNRDEQFRVEPGLALSWQAVDARTWRFKLRQGVVFHDGSPFTVDDAVFSVKRAMTAPSQRSFQLKGVLGARKVDEQTLEVSLEAPDAVLPEKFINLPMMSRAWSEKNKVEVAQDFNGKQETFAVRNANGTGPYLLERYEPDIRTVLRRNPRWWGWSDKRSGNVDEVVWLTIRSDATRLAALISGEADMVLDPPIPDVARLKSEGTLTLAQTPDLGEQYLAFDQARDELADSDVKGRNPFKDIRVRRAVYHAINVDLIAQKVLRGLATPTGAYLSTRVDGSPADLDKRLPFDPAKARALLAEAGYPNGFSVVLDCVNVAWREAVCQAMTAMLTQVGIRTTLRSSPTNQFFPKLSQGTASLVEFGWTPTIDAWPSLNGLFRTWDKSGLGTFNAGRYSNPKLDVLIDAMRVEPDPTRRRAMVATVLRLVAEEMPLVPLYRRTLTWAMHKKVRVVQWPSDAPELRWLRVVP